MVVMNWPPRDVIVVGFVGEPVSGAAALRAPLFQEASKRYFAADPDAAERPRADHGEEEIVALEQQGHATRFAAPYPRVKGGVVLYAHETFLPWEHFPRHEGWTRKEKFFLRYLPRTDALRTLEKWGERFLENTRTCLARGEEESLELALTMVKRARFCAPLDVHRDLRLKVFAHLIAVWRALDRPVERILRDAKIDFDEDTTAQIQEMASGLQPPQKTTKYQGTHSGLDLGQMREKQRASEMVGRAALWRSTRQTSGGWISFWGAGSRASRA